MVIRDFGTLVIVLGLIIAIVNGIPRRVHCYQEVSKRDLLVKCKSVLR